MLFFPECKHAIPFDMIVFLFLISYLLSCFATDLGMITRAVSSAYQFWQLRSDRWAVRFQVTVPQNNCMRRGREEGRMNLFPSSEATILDEQIVRMDRKWLISSDRCQIWQIRAWGHGHSSRNPVIFDRSDLWHWQSVKILELFTSDWQLRLTSDGQISEFSHTWDDLAGICNDL